MWYILGPGSDLTFEIFSRYGLHVKSFQNYDARDLLRLGKDDLVQVGNVLGESKYKVISDNMYCTRFLFPQ